MIHGVLVGIDYVAKFVHVFPQVYFVVAILFALVFFIIQISINLYLL